MLKLHLHKLNYVGTLLSSLLSFSLSFFIILFQNEGKGAKKLVLQVNIWIFLTVAAGEGQFFNSELK
jgi:hypothetical protein